MPRWSTNSGRILLLGDSAHAMHPNAALGFSLIIEDIAALEYLLTQNYSLADVARIWEQARKPRAERIKAYSLANTQLFTGVAPRPKMFASKGESAEVKVKSLLHHRSDGSAPFNSSAFYKWAYDHDAVARVRVPSL